MKKLYSHSGRCCLSRDKTDDEGVCVLGTENRTGVKKKRLRDRRSKTVSGKEPLYSITSKRSERSQSISATNVLFLAFKQCLLSH